MRFLPAALALIALAVTIWAISARVAYAHAALISASPGNNETLRRPPVRVILHFSEGVERKLTRIEVRDKNQQRVDTGDTAFDDNDTALASVGVTAVSLAGWRVATPVSGVSGSVPGSRDSVGAP